MTKPATPSEQSKSRNWRAIADEIEAKFMRPLPPATYPSEWSFGITMDYRDWHEVVKALRGGAAVSERLAPAKEAKIICDLLELGDDRLLASDGPAGGQLPDLSPEEWGKVYRACKSIVRQSER